MKALHVGAGNIHRPAHSLYGKRAKKIRQGFENMNVALKE